MKIKIQLLIALFAAMNMACNSNAQKHSATLGGMSGGETTALQLSADSMLRATDNGTEVISFRMSAYAKDKDALEVESSNAYLTAPMRKAIAEAPPGTKIYFEFIKGKNANGSTFALSPIEFVIK
jgi:hypothetical protein